MSLGKHRQIGTMTITYLLELFSMGDLEVSQNLSQQSFTTIKWSTDHLLTWGYMSKKDTAISS
jgi:hypothetical protein